MAKKEVKEKATEKPKEVVAAPKASKKSGTEKEAKPKASAKPAKEPEIPKTVVEVVKKEEPKPLTFVDVQSVAQLSRAKMKNIKPEIQEEGKKEILEFNEKFKAQKPVSNPAWKK